MATSTSTLASRNLTTVFSRHLPDLSPTALNRAVASTLNFLKSTPHPTSPQLSRLIDTQLTPALESAGPLSPSAVTGLIHTLSAFDVTASTSPDLLRQTLVANFGPDLAQNLLADNIPQASELLASHAHLPDLSPAKTQQLQTEAFKDFLSSSLPPRTSTNKVDYDSLRESTQADLRDGATPPKDILQPPHQPPDRLHPVLQSFLDRGKAAVKNKAVNVAATRFFATPLGQELAQNPFVSFTLKQIGIETATGAIAAVETGATAAGTAATTAQAGAAVAKAGTTVATTATKTATTAATKTAAKTAVSAGTKALASTALSAVAGVLNPVLWITTVIQIVWAMRRVIYKAARTFAITAAFLLTIVAHSIATAVSTAALITLLLPIFFTLVIFLINAGGFVVPPSTLFFGGPPIGPIVPGPGGAYPYCWPTTGWIAQGPPGTTQCVDRNGNPVTCSHVIYDNNAFDITSTINTPIYATHDGTAYAYSDTTGYGLTVTVTSTLGFTTLYAHMNSFAIPPNTPTVITAGTLIGYMDSTGNSTGHHLHYEFRGAVAGVLTCGTLHSCVISFVPPCSAGGSCTYWNSIPRTTGSTTGTTPNTCYARDAGGRP